MRTIQVILCILIQTLVFGQDISVGGMDITWEFMGTDEIRFTATAPDDGWVALGFNDKDDIVGCNLIMVSVHDEAIISEEFFVKGVGDPKPVYTVGSSSQHQVTAGSEKGEKTTISFSMPTVKIDDKHYNLRKGDVIWLICAYSMEDEFDHHSRMRKHIKITL
ncbi:MAG: DOMON domain-containing protein [Bacteroidota bacterium]